MKKLQKIIDIVVTIFFSIFFILSCAFISIIPICADNNYYMKQYVKNGVNQHLPYTLEELEQITDSITNYMFRGASSMQIEINGKNVFSDQAILHMADVKVLFVGGMIIGFISLAILIATSIYLFVRRKEIKSIFRKVNYSTFGVFLLLIIAICIYAIVDFDQAFIDFHHLIFPDPVKFDNAFFPNNDTLINILTIDFFFDIFFAIIIRLVALFAIYFIIIQCLYGKVFRRIKNTYLKLIEKKNVQN